MSVRVMCPSCGLACQVAEQHLGSAIRCPGCKQAFTVRLPASPSASDTQVIPPARPRPVVLRVGWATSPGRLRERNEDCLLVQHAAWAGQAGRHEVLLALVADGMGGHEAGDRASAVAIAAVAQALGPQLADLVAGQLSLDDPEALLDALDRALWEANRAVATAAEEPGCHGMGATAVAALVVDGLAGICHVGDCRAYLCRDGKLEQKTRDQTVVMRMVELGTLSEREARRHRAAGQVTQALGRQYELEPSRQTIELAPGDRLVLACVGLLAHLEPESLADTIATATDPADLAARLVRQADDAGGSDNCTVVVVHAAGA
jgi:protein phosphatase